MENQETIEEAAKISSKKHYATTICSDGFYKSFEEGFIEGVKWQAKRMHSEEDMRGCWKAAYEESFNKWIKQKPRTTFKKWLKQFKK